MVHKSKKNCIFAVDYDTNRFYLLVWSNSSSLYSYLLGVFCSQGRTQLWYTQGTQSLHLA